MAGRGRGRGLSHSVYSLPQRACLNVLDVLVLASPRFVRAQPSHDLFDARSPLFFPHETVLVRRPEPPGFRGLVPVFPPARACPPRQHRLVPFPTSKQTATCRHLLLPCVPRYGSLSLVWSVGPVLRLLRRATYAFFASSRFCFKASFSLIRLSSGSSMHLLMRCSKNS